MMQCSYKIFSTTYHFASPTSPENTCALLWFNLMRVEIRELRPEVVTEDDGVLVHYQSRTNV